MTWWDELKAELNSRLQPNYSPYAGQQPIGRNIWGQAGTVDTHYPVRKPFSASSSAAWMDRNGNTARISVDGVDYTLDNDTWNSILNQADKEQLEYIEQKLRNAGFFHASELPPAMHDTRTDKPNYPPMDLPLEDRRTGEVMLLPPHIYHYEHVPSEMYSLDYDTGGPYLPPYNPNSTPSEGTPIPKDYYGAMPPVGDEGDGLQFDDYMEYAPPVDKDAKQAPQIPAPEPIPLIPYWFDLNDKEYQPTANITRRRLNHA